MQEPPIRQAINLTFEVIVARAASYRNLVIAISIGCCSIVFLALLQWNLAILLSLCWFLPLVSFWLLLDSRRLRRWSECVVLICEEGNLDVEIVCTTVRQMKQLPQNTIAGMLDFLLLKNKSQSEASDRSIENQARLIRRDERSYALVLILSSLGCVIVSVGLFLNLWASLLGVAFCLSSIKISNWYLIRFDASSPVQIGHSEL